MPGHADTLRPSEARIEEQLGSRVQQGLQQGLDEPVHSGELQDKDVKTQKEMLVMGSGHDQVDAQNGDGRNGQKSDAQAIDKDQDEAVNLNAGKSNAKPSLEKKPVVVPRPSAGSGGSSLKWSDYKDIKDDDPTYEEMLSFWEPKPPKVLMKDPDEVPLELHAQIQIYAENA